MKKPILAFFLIVALTAAVPTGAEIFKYVDANGQTRWTDDLNQVPAEQRASVQRFESVENRPGNGLDPDPGRRTRRRGRRVMLQRPVQASIQVKRPTKRCARLLKTKRRT
jgi:hypothetical protein